MLEEEVITQIHRGSKEWNCWKSQQKEKIRLLSERITGLDLSNYDFSNCSFFCIKFIDCQFDNVIFNDADFSRTSFCDCEFINTNFLNNTWKDNIFEKSNFKDVHFADSKDGLYNNFIKCSIIDSTFNNFHIHRGNISRTSFIKNKIINSEFDISEAYGVSAWDNEYTNSIFDITIQNGDSLLTMSLPSLDIISTMYLFLTNRQTISETVDIMSNNNILILSRNDSEIKEILKRKLPELYSRSENKRYPLFFNFNPPKSKDTTEMIIFLSKLCRCIIADLTDPMSVPHELATIVHNTCIPLKPIIREEEKVYSMFVDYWKYDWVLNVYHYSGEEKFTSDLKTILQECDEKLEELNKRKIERLKSLGKVDS